MPEDRFFPEGPFHSTGDAHLFGAKSSKSGIYWTCSDYVYHEHRLRWFAWLCGHWQKLKGVK